MSLDYEDEFIKITGMDETLAEFEALSDDIAQVALQEALIRACGPVIETLMTNVPVRTGELREDVAMSVKVVGKNGIAQVGFPHFNYLVAWLEYGHQLLGHEPLKKFIKDIEPDPFMRTTEEEAATEALEAFKASLDASIDALADAHGMGEKAA